MTSIKHRINGEWQDIALSIYKVGAIYMSVDSTSPATLFGGTWVALEDRMLIGASSTYAVNATGGATSITITSENLPKHTHSVGAHAHGLNSHTHTGGAHTHTLSSHTHTGGGHTHGLNGHTHSVGQHVHSVPEHGHGNNISYSMGNAGGHQHGINLTADVILASGGNYYIPRYIAGANHTDYCQSAGSHSHTLTKSGGVSNKGAFDTAKNTAYNTGGNSGNTASGGAVATGGPSNNNTSSAGAVATGGPSVANTANSTAFDTSDGGFTNSAISTISPYLAVYMWKRTA